MKRLCWTSKETAPQMFAVQIGVCGRRRNNLSHWAFNDTWNLSGSFSSFKLHHGPCWCISVCRLAPQQLESGGDSFAFASCFIHDYMLRHLVIWVKFHILRFLRDSMPSYLIIWINEFSSYLIYVDASLFSFRSSANSETNQKFPSNTNIFSSEKSAAFK